MSWQPLDTNTKGHRRWLLWHSKEAKRIIRAEVKGEPRTVTVLAVQIGSVRGFFQKMTLINDFLVSINV